MSGKYQGVIYQPVFISILPSTGKDLNKKKKAGWYNLFQVSYFLDERRLLINGKHRKMHFLLIFFYIKTVQKHIYSLIDNNTGSIHV